jgi:NAD(P)-dependent dehydrogenase (short-subunit alcohol dehydrogenase family)
MAQRGSGAIINLGSWIARLGIPTSSVYSSTQGALETLTRAWAAEYGLAGVRVNAISPGVILSSTSQSPAAEEMMRVTPANAAGTPDASPAPPCTSPATNQRSFTAP